jgi:5-hydroxyisourate hydrolase-like protein (transthyretin family)
LYDQRGDLGTIKLERGSKVEGRIVDVDGKPLAGVYVSAYPWATAEPQYSGNVEQQVHRAAETDAQGNFTLGPLAPGDYRIEPQEYLDSHPALLRRTSRDQRPLPAMFLPQELTLAAGQTSAHVDVRAIPTVSVEGSIYDQTDVRRIITDMGLPPSSPSYTPPPAITGKVDGLAYRAIPRIANDGTFKFTVPKGLRDARLSISPSRNRTIATAPRWRLGRDQPINNEASIILGSLDEDIHGIEIDYSASGVGRQNRAFGPDAVDERGRGSARGRSPLPAPSISTTERTVEGNDDEIGTVVSVVDAETGSPIKNAQVAVARLKFEKNGEATRTEVGNFATDDEGGFPLKSLRSDWITLPNGRGVHFGTETARYEFLVQVKHPNYPALTQTIVAPTPGIKLPLHHGEEISGVVKSSDGKPAAGVNLSTESESRYMQEARTDSAGRFKMVVATPGDVAVQVYPSDEGVPQRYEFHDKRGDLGVIQLTAGQSITGRMVDLDGKPLAGIYVRAMGPVTQPREAAVLFHRSAMTDAQGNFSFGPLSAGDYRVEPLDSGGDPSTMQLFYPRLEKHPLPGFFAPQKVTLVDGRQPTPIEFRPTSAVVIEGLIKLPSTTQAGLSSQASRRGFAGTRSNETIVYTRYKPKIVGTVNGSEYEADVTIDGDGKFTAKVPKGATDVQLQLANSQGPQVRAGKDKPLVDPGAISLGTVNEDVHGVAIVYP